MANYINGKINILTRDVPEADHKKLLKLAERWMYKTGHKVSINDIMRQAIKLIIKNGGIDD